MCDRDVKTEGRCTTWISKYVLKMICTSPLSSSYLCWSWFNRRSSNCCHNCIAHSLNFMTNDCNKLLYVTCANVITWLYSEPLFHCLLSWIYYKTSWFLLRPEKSVFKICDKYKITYQINFFLCTGIQLKQSSINYITNELCDIVWFVTFTFMTDTKL